LKIRSGWRNYLKSFLESDIIYIALVA